MGYELAIPFGLSYVLSKLVYISKFSIKIKIKIKKNWYSSC